MVTSDGCDLGKSLNKMYHKPLDTIEVKVTRSFFSELNIMHLLKTQAGSWNKLEAGG